MFSVLAPPLAWFTNLVVGIGTVGRRCEFDATLASAQWALLMATTAAALVVIATALGIAVRALRRMRDTARGRDRFIAMAGVMIAAPLLLNVVYFGIMPFVVEPCLRTF